MKVSVVVPVYNTEKYLRRCLDSIVTQNEEDMEIILVDDGSTDGSGEICDLYAENDKRFRVVHKKNGGVSSARNAGMELIRGEYFCFIDSDDYVAGEYISLLIGNMDINGCDMSLCGLSREDIDMGDNNVQLFDREEALVSLFDSAGGIRGYIGGKLFRTSVMKKHDIRFDEEQTIAEDMLFVFDYILSCSGGNCVCMTDSKLYYYENQSGGALTQRGSFPEFRKEWCDPVNACDKLLLKIPPENKRLRRAVELERVMQCVTLIRIMAKYGLNKECRRYKKYVFKHLGDYMLSRNFSLRKKAGAAAAAVCPCNILKRR